MKRCNLIFIFVCAFSAALVNMTDQAKAQGVVDESLSGESVAEQLRQSGVDQPYNLRLGPVSVRAEAGVTTTYNDNINLSKTGELADFIITPGVTLKGNWNVTDLNTLTFNIGIGYQMYLSHEEDDCLLVSPDSEAQFNFFIGEVAINIHEGFSYQQDPTQIGQLSNTVRLSRFNNIAGISAVWDLNTVMVSLSYDHSNLWVTESAFDYLTNQSDTFSPKVTYKISDSISTGLSLAFSDVRYDESFQNDYTTESAGPFVDATLSKNLSVTGQFGGYFSQFDTGGGNGDNENVVSYYGSLGINHRINEYVQESLTAGREYVPGLTSNFTERVYANYTATWQATPYFNLGGNLLWENLNDSDATIRETSNRYGAGLVANDNLTDHTSLTLQYQYLLKDANPSYLGYQQNQVTLNLYYKF
jgi:hypothetical protein